MTADERLDRLEAALLRGGCRMCGRLAAALAEPRSAPPEEPKENTCARCGDRGRTPWGMNSKRYCTYACLMADNPGLAVPEEPKFKVGSWVRCIDDSGPDNGPAVVRERGEFPAGEYLSLTGHSSGMTHAHAERRARLDLRNSRSEA